MSDILCISNRRLCKGDFLTRIEETAACHPRGIVLREKDLSGQEYRVLAAAALEVCGFYGVSCILHGFAEEALCLGAREIHLPLDALRSMDKGQKSCFTSIGASCHSPKEAKAAQELGCTYVIAGHVFETDCKKGMPGRGIDFLRSMCVSVRIPVYAIGGINRENIEPVRRAGAAGVCVMSGVMQCGDVLKYMTELERRGANEFFA